MSGHEQLSFDEIRRFTDWLAADDALAEKGIPVFDRLVREEPLEAAETEFVRSVINKKIPGFPSAPAGQSAETALAALAGLVPPSLEQHLAQVFARPYLNARFKKIVGATAAVVSMADRAPVLYGTAFVVSLDPPRLVTARHVVEAITGEMGMIFADSIAGQRRPVLTGWSHPNWDVAILEMPPDGLPAGVGSVHLDPEPPGPLSRLACAISYPGEVPRGERTFFPAGPGNRHINVGIVEGTQGAGSPIVVEGTTHPISAMRHDCSTRGGYSGGPIVDCERGTVVGMQVRGLSGSGATEGRSLNVALPFSVLLRDPTFTGRLGWPVADRIPQQARVRPQPVRAVRRELAGAIRTLTVQRDWPDIRDRYYVPSLRPLPPTHMPPRFEPGAVLDQKDSPFCTGFALAAAIAMQRAGEDGLPPGPRVSARMLYELARIHDDIPGESYEGSTIRGAIKAFFHNGVAPCEDDHVEFDDVWTLTKQRCRDARLIQLGGYFRLENDFDYFHDAIHNVGSVLVSARIHAGWSTPEAGCIKPGGNPVGAHAVLLVGYDDQGFYVLNSWGPDWGVWDGFPGVAHWSYEDADRSLLDAWVLRLAVPAPGFAPTLLERRRRAAEASAGPRRADLAGTFYKIEEGRLAREGKYGFGPEWVDETRAEIVRARGQSGDSTGHLLLVFHDGLQPVDRVAARTAAARALFQEAGIVQVALAWSTPLGAALEPLARSFGAGADDRSETAIARDRRIEQAMAPILRPLWSAAVDEAQKALEDRAEVGDALDSFLAAALDESGRPRLSVHVAIDGLGALMAEAWLGATARRRPRAVEVANLFLFTPCLPLRSWHCVFEPRLAGILSDLPIGRAWQWSLDPARPIVDTLGPYGKPGPILIDRALNGTPHAGSIGRPAALGRHERLDVHAMVREDAIRNDFLEDQTVLQTMMSIMLRQPNRRDFGAAARGPRRAGNGRAASVINRSVEGRP